MAATTDQPELLTLRELAEYLRVSDRTAYQLVSDGVVPATKVGGQWRIVRAMLDSQLAGSGENSAA
jgi:excisionase family DNA binding protein